MVTVDNDKNRSSSLDDETACGSDIITFLNTSKENFHAQHLIFWPNRLSQMSKPVAAQLAKREEDDKYLNDNSYDTTSHGRIFMFKV